MGGGPLWRGRGTADAGASVALIFGPLGGGRPGGEEVAAAGTGVCGGRAARGRCVKRWREPYSRSGIREPSGLLVLDAGPDS